MVVWKVELMDMILVEMLVVKLAASRADWKDKSLVKNSVALWEIRKDSSKAFLLVGMKVVSTVL
jgi:hypothetical protein